MVVEIVCCVRYKVVNSDCFLLHAAYPYLDKRITSIQRIPGSVGETVTVPCAYPRGRFEDRYGVTWYKGNYRVDTSISQYDHFSIQRDFSMVIGGVKPADASNAYYCEVRVNVTGGEVVVRQAPMINVDVIGRYLVTHVHSSTSSGQWWPDD